MKKIVSALALLLSFSSATISAQEISTEETNVKYVKSPGFARPLVEKWITEYGKREKGVEFRIAKGNDRKKDIDLNIVFGNQDNNAESKSLTVYFGEFAVLPVTAAGGEAAKIFAGKHLNHKRLKQLFFINDDLEEEERKQKQYEEIVIYSGSNAASVTGSFARSYGEETSNFRGKRISGDDIFLNTALVRDPFGVSFNSLPNIFDLNSRSLKKELAIVGIDLNKDIEGNSTGNPTLDEIIRALENEKSSEIAIERIGVSFSSSDDDVRKFMEWILTDGTRYNHDYGLLNLDDKLLRAQKDKVSSRLTAQK